MGKSRKKRRKSTGEDRRDAGTTTPAEGTRTNPLFQQQRTFLHSLSKPERNGFFSSSLDPERRAELWMKQADIGEALINNYSWATPDDRCLRILRHFSPIIEIGCGANAYWSRCMSNAGIDVVAYDADPESGGTLDNNGTTKKKEQTSSDFVVQHGGPAVLKEESERTLFLCYPDEDNQLQIEADEHGASLSLGAACLDFYSGEYVVHVGEIFGDTLSVEHAPWGRSSSPEFLHRLASEYHCILKANLLNWLHVQDTISVWKRTTTCPIVFAADCENDESEEVEYRHIPMEERLPTGIAAPCVACLLDQGQSN